MSTLKRVLALSLALMLALSVSVFALDYKDNEDIDERCADSIDMLVQLNILHKDGYGDGTFRPGDTITRAQAAKMIYVICNGGEDDKAVEYIGANTFADVEAGSWYEGYVEYCYYVGIIAGRGTDTVTGKPWFDPYASITGYELAKMLLVVAMYNPVAEQYTGDNWQGNVLNHARSSGLLDDFAEIMTRPVTRQWAAFMMGNLILNVFEAQYIGDLLVTGSGLNNSWDGKLVGQTRLGLEVVPGIVKQTYTLNLGKGEDTYNTSVLALPYSNGSYYNSNITAGNFYDTFLNNEVEFGYDIPNQYLGKEVKLIAKLKNTGLSGNARYNKNNVTVYGVYETGNTQITQAKMSDLGWGAGKSDSGLDYNDRIRITVSGTNYNFFFEEDGTNTPGKYPLETESKNTSYKGAGRKFQDFLNNYFLGNNFAAKYFGTMAASDVNVTSNKLVADWISATRTANFTARNDDVLIYDVDGDGLWDYVQVLETSYYKVSSINASRISMSGLASIDLEEVNFTNGTPVRGDIVALTENYATGECVYDIAVIAGETVTASSWTLNGNTVETVKLNGDSYYIVNNKLRVVKGASLNKNHQTYYIDRGYVVYSSDAAGVSGGAAPEDTAIVTKVGIATTDVYGDYTVTVRYLTAAGTSKTAIYDIKYDDDAIAGNEAFDKSKAQVDAAIGDNVTADTLTNALYIGKIVQFEETDNGVVFYDIKNAPNATYSDVKLLGTGNAAYDADDGLISLAGSSYELSTNATVWAFYSGTTYKKVAVADLKAFGLTDDGSFTGALVENGSIIAVYLKFAGELPKTDDTTYLVIAGKPYGTTSGVSVPVVLPDGTASDVIVSKVVDVNGASHTSATAISAALKDLTYAMVKYSVSSSKYTLTVIQLGTANHYGNTTITDDNGTRFQADDQWFTYDSDTVVYYVVDDTVTVMEDLVYGGDYSTYVIASGTNLAKYAEYILVNGDGDKVNETNINPAKRTALALEISAVAISDDGAKLAVTFNDVPVLKGTYSNANFTLNGAPAFVAGAPTISGKTMTFTLATAALPGDTLGDFKIATDAVENVDGEANTADLTKAVVNTVVPAIKSVAAPTGAKVITVTFNGDMAYVAGDDAANLAMGYISVAGARLDGDTEIASVALVGDTMTITMKNKDLVAGALTVTINANTIEGDVNAVANAEALTWTGTLS